LPSCKRPARFDHRGICADFSSALLDHICVVRSWLPQLRGSRSSRSHARGGPPFHRRWNDTCANRRPRDATAETAFTRSYSDFGSIQKPEKITQDTAPLLEYNQGDCFEDANANGTYDLDRGKTGLGAAEDIIQYQVSITFDRLVPLGWMLGWDDRQKVGGATVLRNQPYAARTTGVAIVC
jgi:hypothetical protein